MAKYRRLREEVELLQGVRLELAPEVALDDLRRAHDPGYVERVVEGALDPREVRVMGFPWSAELVTRSRRSTGATLAGARAALEDGVAVNLAGGTHHAGPSRGQGYCVFNDAAVTALALRAEGRVRRVLIVDLDVHQGNGTAECLAAEPEVFTLSVHGAKNFPFRKATSDLDVPLPDGLDDAGYLAAVDEALQGAFLASRPELVVYNAGVDVYAHDKLGRLAVSAEGVRARDRLVFEACHAAGAPVVVTMGGGYAPDVEAIVALHRGTVQEALAAWRRPLVGARGGCVGTG